MLYLRFNHTSLLLQEKTLAATDSVISICFNPDGKTLASASQDATVILWNLKLDHLLARGCTTTLQPTKLSVSAIEPYLQRAV